MILIGELKDIEIAKRISQELKRKNIENEVRFDGNLYQIWIYDEKKGEEAFDQYRLAMGLGRQFEMPKEWQIIQSIPLGNLTKTLIGICLFLFVLEAFPPTKGFWEFLRFNVKPGPPLFEDILSGELWRLWTPMFLHFGFVHILFNMLWLKDLGKLLEHFHGRGFLLIFVLLTGMLSNTAQYVVNGPFFGGMSGVVYAMLGFIWTSKKLNPDTPYGLPKTEVVMMIVWFFLCAFGIIPQVANMAHAMGLSSGILFSVGLNFKKSNLTLTLLFSALALLFTGVIVFIELI